MDTKLFLSIIIPFHNESENLQQLLPLLSREILNFNDLNIEFILVDDKSTDDSYKIARDFCSGKKNWHLLQPQERGGQTGAYRLAFPQAQGEFILRMDADLQDDTGDLHLFIEKSKEGADLVMGLRECRKHRRFLRIASMLFDILIISLFDTPLHSNSGSYIAFRSKFVQNIPWRKNDHRYLPLIAMHRGAANIREVIVRHKARVAGVSKYNSYRKIFFGIPEVIAFILRLRRGIYDLRRDKS